MSKQPTVRFWIIPGRMQVRVPMRPKPKRLAIVALAIIAAVVCSTSTARAAVAPSCSLHVPLITEQADGSGVQTGHVTGSCTFAWHSRDEIWYKDRWHMLGWNMHTGGAAGVFVTQPTDSEDYGEYGSYREVISVYDQAGKRLVRVLGPISVID